MGNRSILRPFDELFAVPLRNGLTRPTSVRGVGVKMVNMGEIFANSRVGDIPMERVQVSEPEAEKFLLSPGDLLFARQSLVLSGAGKCSIFLGASEPVTFEGHLIRVRLNSTIACPEFYYYFFVSPVGRQAIESIVEQVAAAGIRGSDLAKLRVPYPDISEQRAIAHILGTLDDKIELNRQTNETLEAMARAIFKSWFVDFDPVRAKMEGRQPAGMDAGTAALFPDTFEDSELGQIPKGWVAMPLPEVIDVNPTRSLRKGVVAPYLDMANMPTQGHSPDEVIARPFGSGMRFLNGDTLVARITPCLENGKTCYVDFLMDGQVGWGSTEYIVLRPKPPLPTEFAYCLGRSEEFRAFAIQSMTGSSGRQRVPAESLSHFLVVSPSTRVAELFGRLIKPLFASAGAATEQSRTLTAIRDALLPKLLSGEIRVKDAERFVEARL